MTYVKQSLDMIQIYSKTTSIDQLQFHYGRIEILMYSTTSQIHIWRILSQSGRALTFLHFSTSVMFRPSDLFIWDTLAFEALWTNYFSLWLLMTVRANEERRCTVKLGNVSDLQEISTLTMTSLKNIIN